MDKLFSPSSVVVVGVSERDDNLARNIVANLIEFNYPGTLYLVGRQAGQLFGRPIVASLDQVPDGVDVAAMLVPAASTPDLIEACGQKGIRYVVIASGGFGEFGAAGQELQARVKQVARRWGVRVVGPNGLGVLNPAYGTCLPFVRLLRAALRPGSIGVLAQSGGVTLSYVFALQAAGLGTSLVVSMGNKLDLNEVDYLPYLLDDERTRLVCLYLESLADGRALFELARAARKPVVLHKANVSSSSAAVAISHTAALATDERLVEAAAAQAGMVACSSFRQAVECAKSFTLPPVRGRNLIVFARSGGHAVIAADAAEAHGFRLLPFGAEFLARARQAFRAGVLEPANPLDLGLIFDFDIGGRLLQDALELNAAALTKSGAARADAVLFIHARTSPAEHPGSVRLLQTIARLSRQFDLPVAACVPDEMRVVVEFQDQLDFPLFTDIDDAVQALAASRDFYARPGPLPPVEASELAGYDRAAIEQALAGASGELSLDRALQLCGACGLPLAEWGLATDAPQALGLAARLGYPLAVKVVAGDISHKSDVGGVVVNVADDHALTGVVDDMLSRLSRSARVEGVLLQKMASGQQVILGGRRDPSFGPVVMFGLGGIYAEVLADVSFRLAPLARCEAEAMIDQVKAGRLLRGVRGQPAADVAAVVDGLLRLSRLMCDAPQIVEVDVNPLIVSEHGALVVDARVRVGA
ncbi:MAG: acetate--CoA ligase family protein [Thermoflexales bacterium]|nr:acetate--CoA ligase family protein [Thermoflexales bacterium]